MPYIHEKMLIPRKLDRRVKITDDMREQARSMSKEGESQRAIARLLGISRKSVQYILDPAKLKRAKERYKELRRDGRYYQKERHTQAVRKHRRYKQSIKGKLLDRRERSHALGRDNKIKNEDGL